ncbi:hypothetical protein [Algoriphagus litoralis]|uniref:hypothetical protein n=1 Tax=Algoriphagus litoralis TaxID=2202829 RepID=UPI000DB94FBC|nr:hypothetical protein [Algoriphagus litoralis]
MNKYNALLLLPLGLILMSNSCGSESKKDEVTSEISEVLGEATEASGMASLDDYTGKLNELLTLEMAASLTGYDPADASEDYSQIMGPQYHSIAYTWDRGRTKVMKVGTMSVDVPDLDVVQLDGLAEISKKDFEYNNRQLTEQDLKDIDNAMSSKLDEKVADGSVSKDQGDMAADMAKGFLGDLTREPVSGVGEMAVWMPGHHALSVYEDGVTFILRVNLNDDMETCKSKAAVLAKQILEKL